MPQSLSNILLHVIFSTKNREDMISPLIEAELHAYMASIYRDRGCPIISIGGTANHVHSLCRLKRTITVADLIQAVKQGSSNWIKTRGEAYTNFYWQRGYGAFSVSESMVGTLKAYIARQKEHHQRVSFQGEYRLFLQKYGVGYDEAYVWD